MSFSKVFSAQIHLLKVYRIDVEVDLSNGLNAFSVVGLPDKAVAEAKDRVSAAIKNCGFDSPKSKNQKVIVSLAPADVRKEGPNFDVAIALAYLLAADNIRFDPSNKIFLGELSLDGKIRPIKGALPLTLQCKKLGFKEIYLPEENIEEARVVKGIKIYGALHLKQIIFHLNEKDSEENNSKLNDVPILKAVTFKEIVYQTAVDGIDFIDFKDIKGQDHAKRALEISASGGHNIMMYGPPGTGKTMLAKAFSSILPKLRFEEVLETSSIHSSVGLLQKGLITYPPFRSPHHTASYVSLIGGGTHPKPGEITLAHRGILFMDEFPEFDNRALEALRQPLEEKKVNISRARSSVIFPSNFILIATMNPCPCGNKGSKKKECQCPPQLIQKYERKISGPIIDRIDMWIEVGEIDYDKLGNNQTSECSEKIRKRIEIARIIQEKRFKHLKINTNSEIKSKDIFEISKITQEAKQILKQHSEKLSLSARTYHKLIRVARTIADLKNKAMVDSEEILEALQYRLKNFKKD